MTRAWERSGRSLRNLRGQRWGVLRQWLRMGMWAIWMGSLSPGCLVPSQPDWAIGIDAKEFDQALQGLPPEARSALLPLSEIFYGRITSRRFNSRATFEDPSVRQFFTSIPAYSDYYAGLVDAIDRANIKFNRPTVVELLKIDHTPSGSVRMRVRLIGENDLPLRWWSAAVDRDDEWIWQDGRWWIVPGKV